MTMKSANQWSMLLTALFTLVVSLWPAQAARADIDPRYYVSPMYSRAFADNARQTDDGDGGMLAVGKQLRSGVAFELYIMGASYDAKAGDGSMDYYGFGGALSYFPFAGADAPTRGLYGLLGAGFGDGSSDIETTPQSDHSRYLFDIGLGYVLPIFRDIALRLDVRYRYDELTSPYGSFGGKNSTERSGFEEPVASVGLLIPIGKLPEPPPPVPVAVVTVPKACSDGSDNDGDGLIDFPNDPGCSSPDDDGETDPPQCSDGKDNDGDGLIDFPNDTGCSSSDDIDETDPCKMPAPGEKVSLKGCGTGDVIILRGVNFEFYESRLTVTPRPYWRVLPRS